MDKKRIQADGIAILWWNMRSCRFPCTNSKMDPKQASARVVMAVVWWKIRRFKSRSKIQHSFVWLWQVSGFEKKDPDSKMY